MQAADHDLPRPGFAFSQHLTPTVNAVRAVVRLVEDAVLFLGGLVTGWVAVDYMPGEVLPLVAVTVVLAAGGRLLFNGTVWTAGIGLVVAGLAGAGLLAASLFSSVGS